MRGRNNFDRPGGSLVGYVRWTQRPWQHLDRPARQAKDRAEGSPQMAHDRPLGLTLAGGFMVLAVIGYSTGAISALLTGGMYPSVLGGTGRVDGLALFTGYAPLVPIAAVLAREILYERSFRTVLVGFAAWFVIACLDLSLIH